MSASHDDPVGRSFGPYKVLGALGRGGMAAVFRAVHEPTGAAVALKIFLPPAGVTTDSFKRAKREVVALQMCAHPNILKVHGFEFGEQLGYLALEVIDGKNLQELCEERGHLDVALVMRVVRDMTSAIACMHSRGLFHRDLKPANIMVENGTERSVLLDFGIVKARFLAQITGGQRELMGTLTYMAPEQFLDQAIDGRTDLYQLGLVMYRAISGGDPPSVVDLVEQAGSGGTGLTLPVRPADPVTANLETVIANLTHTNPDARYRSVQELVADLDRVAAGQAPVPRASATPKGGASGKVGALRSTARAAIPGTVPPTGSPRSSPGLPEAAASPAPARFTAGTAIAAAIAAMVLALVWVLVR